MLKNLSLVFCLALISAFGINTLEAQTKNEKKITIIKKVIDKDGKETVERIEASGAEANKYLKELKSADGEHIDIDIDFNEEGVASKQSSKQHYKMKVIDDDGQEQIMEWNGSGEMPEKMKKLLEQYDLNIGSEEGEEDAKKQQIVKMKFIDDDGEVHELESNDINIKRKEIRNADGSKSIEVQVESEDIIDLEDGVISKTIEVEVNNADSEQEEIIVEVIEENNNKAQLGIMIENAPDGVTIKGFAPESNAKSGGLAEGDVITNFNGTNIKTIEALVSEVGKYKAGDEVKVRFRRNNENLEKIISLTPRTGVSKKKFKWKEAGGQ